MKKVLLAIAVVAVLFSVSSCNKQQKCQCTYKLEVAGLTVEKETEVFLSEDGKTCKDYEAQYSFSEIDCHRVY